MASATRDGSRIPHNPHYASHAQVITNLARLRANEAMHVYRLEAWLLEADEELARAHESNDSDSVLDIQETRTQTIHQLQGMESMIATLTNQIEDLRAYVASLR